MPSSTSCSTLKRTAELRVRRLPAGDEEPTVQDLIDAELVPENLRNTIVTEKEIKDGLYQYALDTPTQTKWEDAWSTFKAG